MASNPLVLWRVVRSGPCASRRCEWR